jgi:hypothetical protein
MQVIIKRVIELINKCLLELYPGIILKVQVLGDAAFVWQSMKVNGTTIVLKVIYNDKNSDGKKVIGDGVNIVQNQRAIRFYLGDVTRAKLRLHAPNLPEQLAKVSTDGIVVDGVHNRVQFLMGGDIKFLNSMIGLKNNASMYPCSFYITHKDLFGSNSLSLKPFISSYTDTVGLARPVGWS